MTDDELTVLMIAAEGESMIPVGRWEKPVRDLAARGLMRANDSVNYVITEAGRAAVRQEEAARDGAFAKALNARRSSASGGSTDMHVDMTVSGRQIVFDLTYDPNFVADVQTREYLIANGACEPEVVHLMCRVLRNGDFVIDGGANIGLFTMIMSRLVGEQGHVEAFEPSTLNFKKLRANLDLNKIENVSVINRALWSEDADVTLHQAVDSGMSSLMPFDGVLNYVVCGGLTLDRWCGAYEQPCRFLKLDIEGAELHALMGANSMLTRGIDFISCEMNIATLARFGTTQVDLRDHMASKGYDTFLLMENGERPEVVLREQAILPDKPNFNVLFSTVEKVHKAWSESL